MPTLPELYSSIIERQVADWSVTHNLRAPTFGRFRAEYRLEDNCFILKKFIECTIAHDGQFCAAFVDLEKVYDRINRSLLWRVLLQDSHLPPDLVWRLMQLYSELRVQLREDIAHQLLDIAVGIGLK